MFENGCIGSIHKMLRFLEKAAKYNKKSADWMNQNDHLLTNTYCICNKKYTNCNMQLSKYPERVFAICKLQYYILEI